MPGQVSVQSDDGPYTLISMQVCQCTLHVIANLFTSHLSSQKVRLKAETQ